MEAQQEAKLVGNCCLALNTMRVAVSPAVGPALERWLCAVEKNMEHADQ